jgi:hypothetical protein
MKDFAFWEFFLFVVAIVGGVRVGASQQEPLGVLVFMWTSVCY